MNLFWIKILLAIGIVGLVTITVKVHDTRVFARGVSQEKIRRDKIDAANTAAAKAELAVLNEKLLRTQTDLNLAIVNVAQLEKGIRDEQTKSVSYQMRLAAGTERVRVAVTQCHTDSTESADGSSSASVGDGPETVAYLAAGPAIAIERLRYQENNAIARLDACVGAYQAVQHAINTPP